MSVTTIKAKPGTGTDPDFLFADHASAPAAGKLPLVGLCTTDGSTGAMVQESAPLPTKEAGCGTVTASAGTLTASTATQLAASALSGRRGIYLQNQSTSDTIFLGTGSSVATSGSNRGIKLGPGGSVVRPWGSGVAVYIISDGTPDYYIEEFK